MDATPAFLDVTRRNSEPSTLQGTLGSLEGENDQSSIFPGFVGILAIFLVIIAACILWNWNKQKKRKIPYFQVAPSLTLPRPRQRTKNIYDFLPWQQAELGRHQSSSRGFSTENLLSRNSDSPEHSASQADGALQMHRACVHAAEYTVGIYDNATVPQVCGHLASSAHRVGVRACRHNFSISSEESNDYVNIPAAEENSETLPSTNSLSEYCFALPSAQGLEFIEEGHRGYGDAIDHTRFLAPKTKVNDTLSDGEDSSQTSNDYINMTGLDLQDMQETQPRVAFQCCRDYENVPSADPNGSQPQAEEEMTFSNIDHGEGTTESPKTHIQPVWRATSTAFYVAFQPSTQINNQMAHEEELSEKDSSDYENVLITESGGRNWEQGLDTRRPSDAQMLSE
ncbi:lymphocyte transmembrane adapter 1 [Nannospalax galili]|uniref:lymphocyte transmembrane adapter 1 n=1 Tax=Nannospalax galili TaxID=1026970 RepID=UPI0004ED61AF|nr:lymphocyte transmembrane adapter 1 [Nannospalax galili]